MRKSTLSKSMRIFVVEWGGWRRLGGMGREGVLGNSGGWFGLLVLQLAFLIQFHAGEGDVGDRGGPC